MFFKFSEIPVSVSLLAKALDFCTWLTGLEPFLLMLIVKGWVFLSAQNTLNSLINKLFLPSELLLTRYFFAPFLV